MVPRFCHLVTFHQTEKDVNHEPSVTRACEELLMERYKNLPTNETEYSSRIR